MSQFIKFYFTSSVLNMFRTLIHLSSGACDFSIVSPHWSCVLVSMCVGVLVWLGYGGIHVAGWSFSLLHTHTHTHDQCGDTIEKSQAPDDGCINVRNMLSIEEVKQNLINGDIKLVSYSLTTTMMHGQICIRLPVLFKVTQYRSSYIAGVAITRLAQIASKN